MLFIFVIGCCGEEHKSDFPEFEDNANEKDIYKDVRDISLKYDFSVVFFSRAQTDYNWFKIFSVQNNKWMKIEIRQVIIDTARQRKDPEYVISRDIITTKECRPEEANAFLSKLKTYNLFALPEEDNIPCEGSEIFDGETICIQLVSSCKVRNLIYHDIPILQSRCPELKILGDILNIEKLFKEEWDVNSQ